MTAESKAALLLSMVPGITAAKLRGLYRQVGSFQSILSLPLGRLPPALDGILQPYRDFPALYHQKQSDRCEQLKEGKISILCLADDDYPALLKEINRPPPLLYIKGDKTLCGMPQIAIVGSRRASAGGLNHAQMFGQGLAASGFVVSSGMALGVDGAAHQGALKSGKTIAVLGSGVDVVYPRQHKALYDQIIGDGGTIISEFPPGTGVRAEHFPQRNRIISGLSLGVLVIEAAVRSGSLITARLAMEQGREVFAIPGSIHNINVRGCHQLIREGATLTESLQDIVDELGGMLAYKVEELQTTDNSISSLQDQESRVLNAMGYDPVDMDTLLSQIDIAMGELIAVMVNLELLGYVESTPAGFNRIR